MSKNTQKLLAEGLAAGYAGKGEIKPVVRASFIGKSSHYEPHEGGIYHDEWFTPDYLGGGQELVEINGEKFTRLYGGGTPLPEVLEQIGVTQHDVGDYLKRKLSELGGSTRLFEDCIPEADEDWQYSYEITQNGFEDIPVTTAVERITYKGTLVHVHPFILTPLI